MRPAEPADDLLRWRDSSRDPRALSERAADLVEAVRDLAPLAPETLARIELAVAARRPSRVGRGLPLGLRLAFLTVLVLASVATARGTMTLWRRYVAAPTVPATRARHVGAPHVAAATRPAPSVVEILPLPPPAAAPEPTPISPPAPAAHARRTAMATPEPRAAEDTTTSEAPLLARALSRLRQGHDPAGALALLDQYTRAFPHGVLESEALSARLEAVIKMDDRETALRLLDDRSVFAGRLGAQLLLTRAELRASAGRYADALADFDRLLGPSKTSVTASPMTSWTAPADVERGLYDRAVCLGHLGRDERARADLDAYQRRFPQGKHAAEVARLLKGTGPEHRP